MAEEDENENENRGGSVVKLGSVGQRRREQEQQEEGARKEDGWTVTDVVCENRRQRGGVARMMTAFRPGC